MNKSARQTVASADAVMLIAEAGRSPGDIELSVINQIKKNSLPSMLVLNKIDLCNREALAESIAAYAAVHSFDAVVPASAVNSKNVSVVLEEARQFLHEGPFMFDEDAVSYTHLDVYKRQRIPQYRQSFLHMFPTSISPRMYTSVP